MKRKKALIALVIVSLMTAAVTSCTTQSSSTSAQADNTAAVEQDGSDTTQQTIIAAEAASQGQTAENDTENTAQTDGQDTSAAAASGKSASASKTTTAKNNARSSGTTAKNTGGSSGTTAKNAGSSKTTKKSTATTAKSSGSANGTTAKTTAKTTTKAAATTAAADTATAIKLTKNGNAECKSSNVTIDAPSLFETEGIVYIEKGGDYVITSDVEEWHGQIVIQLANTEKANIRIENVNISSQKANVIKIIDTNIDSQRSFVEADLSSGSAGGDTDNALRDEMKEISKQEKAPNVDLSFPTGTSSSFTTSANSLSGVIYNESKLTIKGNGAVHISATKNRNNAICSTKSITFKNVTAKLTTAGNGSISALSSARGIFTFSKVYVESGTLNIASNGDGIRCEEFNSSGGKTNIVSSACDGIDADDGIIISGGNVTAKGLQKSCFKVRRVNNQEKIDEGDKTIKKSDGITKSTHTFKINGGTVVGEGKNITTVQPASTQASITCRSVKAEGTEEAKKAISFTIKGTGVSVSSAEACIKYLYSSSAIDKSKEYTVSSSGYASKKVSFSGTVGDVRIEANR